MAGKSRPRRTWASRLPLWLRRTKGMENEKAALQAEVQVGDKANPRTLIRIGNLEDQIKKRRKTPSLKVRVFGDFADSDPNVKTADLVLRLKDLNRLEAGLTSWSLKAIRIRNRIKYLREILRERDEAE